MGQRVERKRENIKRRTKLEKRMQCRETKMEKDGWNTKRIETEGEGQIKV